MPTTPRDAQATFRRYLSAVVLNSLAHAEAIGLHPTDLYALNLLELDAPLSAGALADRTGLSTGATTRLVDRLEKAGHVRRTPDPSDRRRILIDVADDGPLATDESFAVSRRRVGEVLAQFDEREREVLLTYFERAAVAFQEATDEVRTQRADR